MEPAIPELVTANSTGNRADGSRRTAADCDWIDRSIGSPPAEPGPCRRRSRSVSPSRGHRHPTVAFAVVRSEFAIEFVPLRVRLCLFGSEFCGSGSTLHESGSTLHGSELSGRVESL